MLKPHFFQTSGFYTWFISEALNCLYRQIVFLRGLFVFAVAVGGSQLRALSSVARTDNRKRVFV